MGNHFMTLLFGDSGSFELTGVNMNLPVVPGLWSEYSELKHFPQVARKSHETASGNAACTEVPCLWQEFLVHINGMYRLPPSVCARNWKCSHAQPILLNLF